jgi:hypothetical protein
MLRVTAALKKLAKKGKEKDATELMTAFYQGIKVRTGSFTSSRLLISYLVK